MRKIVALVALLVVSGFLLISTVDMHEFGSPAEDDMDQYMIDNAQSEVSTNNVVTSVVFDYRGFDTLGEATVLFTAVVGVSMLFRRRLP
jgi:multisubunit Na+/H+ antiporter MnhB subunit